MPRFVRHAVLPLICATMLAGCGMFGERRADDERSVGLRLADATLGAGAPESALSVSDGLLRHDPHDAAAQMRRGRALLALHRPAEAAQSFSDVLAATPGERDAAHGLAQARGETGDAAGAEAAWRLALGQHANDSTAAAGLAVSLDLQDRHAEAQALYRGLLARRPDDAALRSDLGLSLALSGHGPEGVALLSQAAAGDGGPNGPRLRHNLAVGTALAGDWVGARALLADLDPASARAALDGVRLLAPDAGH